MNLTFQRRSTQMRKATWMGGLLAGLVVTTLAHAAPTPPSRTGFGPGPGGMHFGRHESSSHEDPYEDCGDSDVADLDLRAWSLDRELASEDNVMTVFRLTNRGPCPARNVRVQSGGYDVFTDYVFTCPDLASDVGGGECVFPTLAPGETKVFLLTATVCGFVTGEGREQATYAALGAESIDPDAPEGRTTSEIVYAWVHMVGPYDDDACKP